MVRQHQTGDTGRVGKVGGFFGEGDLDGGRAPGNKSGETAFAYAEERFVDVGWVEVVALDDVENGDVAGGFGRFDADHGVFGLEEAAHHVENGGFAHGFCLRDVVAREGSVGGHEEVAAWSGDKGGDDADEVVVHVAWVAEGGSGGGHDG